MRLLMIQNAKVVGALYGVKLVDAQQNNPGVLFVTDTGEQNVLGMDYANDVLSGEPTPEPVESLESKKSKLKESVTAKRVQVETGGTVIAGIPVATDAASQAKLTGALSFVGRKPSRQIKWKTSAGTFVPLTRAHIEALSDGVGEFVALCFDAEAAHYAAIDLLADVAACQAYDINTGWPV